VRTYLYGLILARSAHVVPAHITGVAGSAVRVLHCDKVGAIVSTLDQMPGRANLDDVRAHDHALQAVVHHGATAAAGRFGQTFDSDAEARRHVIEHGGRVNRLLEEFDGCVEMRLLFANPPASAPPPERPATDFGPGREYLEQIRGARNAYDHLALRQALGPLIRAEKVEALPKARGVAFSHLIERSRETEYRSAIMALPALAVGTVVGPLAIYTFAEPQ
jgi:hypothetical protein